MGLFDSFKAKTAPVFDEQKAIMTIVVAALLADGEADDDEVARLRSMCARSPIFSSNSREQDDLLIDFAIKMIKQHQNEAVIKAGSALKPLLRETAFAFAVEIVLADGVVGNQEEVFISKLASDLGVEEGLAGAIVAVTEIRGRSI